MDSFYSPMSARSKSAYLTALTVDINVFHPFANSTVEVRNNVHHYNNHPVSLTIGHWVPARGYTSSGARGFFADPAHSRYVSWGDKPKEYFDLDSGAMALYYLHDHGIVW